MSQHSVKIKVPCLPIFNTKFGIHIYILSAHGMDLVFISFLKFSVHCASACSCFGQCIVGKVFININALFTMYTQ